MSALPILLSLLSLAATSAPASGQPAESTKPAAAESPPDSAAEEPVLSVMEEVVVVSLEKRPQSLAETTASVTVFGQAAVEQLGMRRGVEIAGHTANMVGKESFGNANPIFVIRGVGLADFNANSTPSAGLYIDEVALVSPLMMGFQFFDVERIEVLRGPQGTLYGRNATAGAINLTTRRPAAERSALLLVGYGRYDTAELEASEGGALGARWSQRVALYGKRSGDGPFVNRTLGERRGDVDLFGWRLALDGQPSTATGVRLNLHGGRDRSHGYEFEHLGLLDAHGGGFCPPFVAGSHAAGPCVDLAGYSDDDGDPFAGDWNLRPEHDHDSLGALAALEHRRGHVQVTSISGWEHYDREQWVNADASPQVGLDMRFQTEIEQLSQEVRASNRAAVELPGDRDLDWVVGVFASHDRLNGQPNQLFLLDEWLRTRAAAAWRQSTTTAALFGHSNWRLGDHFTLTAGTRYSWEDKEFRGSTTDLNPFGTSCLLHPACAPGFSGPVTLSATDETLRESHLAGNLGAAWSSDQGHLLYANVRRGFKSGGFNGGFAASDFELEPYRKETLLAYETGLKVPVGGGTLLSATAFLYDYRDLQLFAIRTNEGGLPTVVLTNAADARIAGGELELWSKPIAGLEARLGLGLLEGELVDFQYGAQDLSGNELPNAPRRQLDVMVAYRRPLVADGGLDLLLAADYGYTSESFREATNHPLFRAGARGLLGARLGVDRGRWEVALWGKNLTDERYVSEIFDQRAIGQALRVYGWPRTWGATLTLRWS